jgi:hypothetical protein
MQFGLYCVINPHPMRPVVFLFVLALVITDSPLKHVQPVDMVAEKSDAQWNAYWATFKQAIIDRDTLTIIKGTYFPFFDNQSLFSVQDFKELTLPRLFKLKIKKADVPVFTKDGDFGGTNNETNASATVHCDSTYFWYFPHEQYSFGKVKGAYKLMAVTNPG